MKTSGPLVCRRLLPELGIVLIALWAAGDAHAQAGSFTKAAVGEQIKRVEDGVDEFRKYLDNRGETVKNNAETAQNSGARRLQANTSNTQARKDHAKRTKDDLDDALGDLNSST